MKEIKNRHLFMAMIRGRKARGLNRDMVGFAVERTVGPTRLDDALAYAEATNDTNPIYTEGETPPVPPMYIARLVHPLLLQILVNPDLNMNILRMVHGQQSITWHESLRVGDTIDVRLEITSITDTSAGEFMELTFTAKRAGELVGEAAIGLMIRGSGTGAKKEKKPEVEKPAPKTTRDIQTDVDQPKRYAPASGDHNFIHTSNLLAKLAGLPRTILHGMSVLAMATNALTAELAAGDITKLQHIAIRFAAPAFPGEKLQLVIYPAADDHTPFEVLNTKGKEVLKNGIIRFRA